MNIKTIEFENQLITTLEPLHVKNGGIANAITLFDQSTFNQQILQPAISLYFRECSYKTYAPPIYSREILFEIICSSTNRSSGKSKREDAYAMLDGVRALLLDKELFENSSPIKIKSENLMKTDATIIALSGLYSFESREDATYEATYGKQ